MFSSFRVLQNWGKHFSILSSLSTLVTKILWSSQSPFFPFRPDFGRRVTSHSIFPFSGDDVLVLQLQRFPAQFPPHFLRCCPALPHSRHFLILISPNLDSSGFILVMRIFLKLCAFWALCIATPS